MSMSYDFNFVVIPPTPPSSPISIVVPPTPPSTPISSSPNNSIILRKSFIKLGNIF